MKKQVLTLLSIVCVSAVLSGCAGFAGTNPAGEVVVDYNPTTGAISYRSNKDMSIEYVKPDGTKLVIKSDASEAIKLRAEADKVNADNYSKLIDLLPAAGAVLAP